LFTFEVEQLGVTSYCLFDFFLVVVKDYFGAASYVVVVVIPGLNRQTTLLVSGLALIQDSSFICIILNDRRISMLFLVCHLIFELIFASFYFKSALHVHIDLKLLKCRQKCLRLQYFAICRGSSVRWEAHSRLGEQPIFAFDFCFVVHVLDFDLTLVVGQLDFEVLNPGVVIDVLLGGYFVLEGASTLAIDLKVLHLVRGASCQGMVVLVGGASAPLSTLL
jgi:hypothetical protein